jgi:NDP-sugar pyrophosphorylase family protein
MKAMILAAGLGTRLRPLTDNRPKALVEIGGRTLLDLTLARLRAFGVREVIINVHHFADRVIDYLQSNNNFGMRIEISCEDVLLDTGGGLKKAGHFFTDDAGPTKNEEPFILHNADVLSSVDLRRMIEFHNQREALATLAVKDRKTSRYLLFDGQLQLCGRRSGDGSTQELVRSTVQTQALGFCGIHIICPRLIKMMTEEGTFSIIDCYLRLAAQRQKIVGFRADEYYWRDLGRLNDIEQATSDLNTDTSLKSPISQRRNE